LSRREVGVRLLGLALCLAYAGMIVWLYATQPRTLAEVRGGVAASLGAYSVDASAFREGLGLFHADRFVEARLAFERADPARRDPVTQFYVAYSFCRQGWGRLYRDDRLYRQGLAALERAVAAAPGGRVVVNDPALRLKSSDALRAELEGGLTRDLSDLNPLKVFGERP
jgi:hypothetical protein